MVASPRTLHFFVVCIALAIWVKKAAAILVYDDITMTVESVASGVLRYTSHHQAAALFFREMQSKKYVKHNYKQVES